MSATMLVNFYGADISPEKFVDDYLECEPVSTSWGYKYVPNPKEAYAGDPRSETKGWGCFAPVIVKALNNCLPKNYYAKNITGTSINTLKSQYIDNDIPVLIWATIRMEDVNSILQWQSNDKKETFLYPANEHKKIYHREQRYG